MRRTAVVNRQSSKVVKAVTELDAFPKVPDNFKETSASGGGTSIVTFAFILILVIFELQYYSSTQLKFDYEVDTDMDQKLKINIDMTVAMRCDMIGADILDVTGQDTQKFGNLEMTNTHYKLSPEQQRYHDITKDVNEYMRQEYHAIQELLWLSVHSAGLLKGMPKREDEPNSPPDACRIHGSLEVNKVAGNFHVTAGKHFPELNLGLGHVHLETSLTPMERRKSYSRTTDYNFTHRIDHFSFGAVSGGIINPLDGEEQIANANMQLYQYFMKIVPLEVRTYSNHLDTYQFSVTERSREVNHQGGSHGVPGIFVKYDLSFLKIRVREEHQPYWQFLVRLCGIVGGIFVVSGLLHNWIGFIVDVLCCRLKVGKYNGQIKSTDTLLLGDNTSDLSLRRQLSGNSVPYDSSDKGFNPVDIVTNTVPDVSNIGLVSADLHVPSSEAR